LTDQTTEAPARPLVTLVVSIYGVEEYLSAFLDSLDELDFDRSRVELIFVDDGSPDRSVDILLNWIDCTGTVATVLHKPNGGLSSARNFGMERATGTWISFPDPDDVLSVDYLANLAEFLESPQSEGVSMAATRLVQFVHDPSQPIQRHPLDFKFDRPLRIVDLNTSPRYVHLHAATGFYRLDVVRHHGLRFDERITPVFEDAAFTGHYLLDFARPTIAFLGETTYYYRKREDQSSLTGTSWSQPGRYDAVLAYGHLELIAHANGQLPIWLQHIMFYDLQWYPKADQRNVSETAAIVGEQLDRFNDLFGRVLAHISDEVIMRYTASGVALRYRLAFLARKNGRIPDQDVAIIKLDRAQEIQLLRYYTVSAEPAEVLRVDGVIAEPVFAKSTSLGFFGSVWLYERDLWVTALEPVTLEIDGVQCRIQLGGLSVPVYEAMPARSWSRFVRRPSPLERNWNAPRLSADLSGDRTEPTPAAAEPPREVLALPATAAAEPEVKQPTSQRFGRALRRRITGYAPAKAAPPRVPASPPPEQIAVEEAPSPEQIAARVTTRAGRRAARRRYHRAWVLIDRDVSGQDNAEAFYRYLSAERPGINAWFVLNRDSADWDRLEQDGFRLIAHGTEEHIVLMLNAKFLISSQMDEYIVRPYDTTHYPSGQWKFVALQHGVVHNDLSRWLNPKPIRMWITSSAEEHRGIVGNGSPYQFSEKEVQLTGLPRHDSLLAKARALSPQDRKTIVIMPTWRDHLLGSGEGGHIRQVRSEFQASDYARSWFGLVRSPELLAVASAAEAEIVFMAHPNLQHVVTEQDVGPDVHLARYADHDVQDVIARAQLMVTDYSSLAFEAAYVGTPVVYFQFDQADFYSGLHPFRRYLFSHEQDGFGPVVETVDDAIKAIAGLVGPGREIPDEYRLRIENAFPYRDGRCSERVYEAIIEREQSRVRRREPSSEVLDDDLLATDPS
jgi:glycosyltransferase involved in cell wall biosynthesis